MDRNIKKGIVFALLSAVCGAYPYIFSKYVLGYVLPGSTHPLVSPEFFCGAYHFLAALYFCVWFFVTRRRDLFTVPRSSLGVLAGMGLFECLSVIALFWAVKIMDPTLVSFFNNSQTIFIIALSALFLKERFNPLEIFGTVVSLMGVCLISYRSSQPVIMGMGLTLGSALLFSGTVILVKKALRQLPPLSIAFYRAVVIAVFFIAISLAQGDWVTLPRHLTWAIAIGALFGPFLNILFYFTAMKYFEASKVSLIRASQPLFVLLNAALFLQTIPEPRQMAGGAVIILGLYVLVKGHEKTVAS